MRSVLRLCCVLWLAVGIAGVPTSLFAANQKAAVHTVRGQVVATNLKDEPHTIVIRSGRPNKEELIVGASVPPEAKITKGARAITLADVKVGDVADLTYSKNPDGLVARSIHIR